jgi:putative ABC transport system permease protein
VVVHLRALWRNIFKRKTANPDLDEELRGYLEMTAAEKVRCGMAAEAALREARKDLGGLEQVKQRVRDTRAGVSMDIAMQDVLYACRTLLRNRAFSSVVVLTLALGIGANTAIFTIVNGVLLKPLPYPEPDRLLMLWEQSLTDRTLGPVAPANYYDWREQSHSFAKMAAIDPYPDFILNGSGQARRLTGAAVSHDFFSLLGVNMAVGRDFLPQEDHPGSNHVVVLSYSTWQSLFGGRSDVVGAPLRLNDADYTVVGVLPRNFSLVSKASDYQSRNKFDLWTPLALPSPPEAWQRGTHSLCVFARLKPGVSRQQAQVDLDQVAGILQRLYPGDDKGRGITAVPLAQHVVTDVRAALLTLLATVGMVLLLACANIANLMLTRGASRQKEIAVRIALGAGRKRIARQLITESLVLAVTGGLLGLALVFVAVPALVRHLPANLPRTSEIMIDWRVLAFTSLLSVLTGIIFGLLPFLQSSQINPIDSLKQGGRGIATDQSGLRSALIVGQVAVALVLLTGAGLMTKSLWKLTQVSPGFQTEHILTARLSLPPGYTNGNAYGTGKHPRISLFQQALLDRVRRIPGVQSAAFVSYLPMAGADSTWAFDIQGRPAKPPGVFDVASYRPVSPEYFDTMHIPVLRGRRFDAGDTASHPLVVEINASMARTWWNQQNPIGQRVNLGDDQWRTIVGVVGDVHHEGLGTKPDSEIYLPYEQVPTVEARPIVVLRTSIEPAGVTAALRRAVSQVDANVPLDQIETMTQIVYGSVEESRFRTSIVAMFALLALFVAGIGLYGVMSYAVNQKTREFGIRMAVGATPGAILRVVLGTAARLVSIGICLGLAGAVLLARGIASLLYGVAPFDVATLASVSILLATIALLASFVPAWRASKVDPMECLRYE